MVMELRGQGGDGEDDLMWTKRGKLDFDFTNTNCESMVSLRSAQAFGILFS